MRVNIGDIAQYGRHYIDEVDGPRWWFCVADYSIYSMKELTDRFHYEADPSGELLQNGFVPLFQTDIVACEKDYIRHKNTREMTEYFKDIPDKEFDREFKIYIDGNGLMEDWWYYERQALMRDAIAWCKENGIGFSVEQRRGKGF